MTSSVSPFWIVVNILTGLACPPIAAASWKWRLLNRPILPHSYSLRWALAAAAGTIYATLLLVWTLLTANAAAGQAVLLLAANAISGVAALAWWRIPRWRQR